MSAHWLDEAGEEAGEHATVYLAAVLRDVERVRPGALPDDIVRDLHSRDPDDRPEPQRAFAELDRLVRADPGEFAGLLAQAGFVYARALRYGGHGALADACIADTYAPLRGLAATDPAGYGAVLAERLYSQSVLLAHLRDTAGMIAFGEGAVAARSAVAASARSAAGHADEGRTLARQWLWHANLLYGAGHLAEAIAAGERAVEEFRSRGSTGDSAYAAALVTLGVRLQRDGRADWEASLTAGLAAYELLSAPERPNHAEFRRVRSLAAYAEALVDAGRPAEATAAAGKAVAVCRAADRCDSPSVVAELPSALRAQALVDLALGRPDRALAPIREAVALCGREPAEVVIDRHATALGTLARVLAALGERGAVRAAGRSVALYRELVALSPTRRQHEDLRTDRPPAELLAEAQAFHTALTGGTP